MTKKLIIYPRGFIGYDLGIQVDTQTTQQDLSDILSSVKYNKPINKPSPYFPGNSEVDKLWDEYQSRTMLINSFEFREEILKTAFSVFNTHSFFDWTLAQNYSPYFTELNKRFLNDTFSFISGQGRSINLVTWSSLLKVKEATQHDKNALYKTQDFFNLSNVPAARRDFGLAQSLVSWCSNENGFDDLVGTLNILFGTVET